MLSSHPIKSDRSVTHVLTQSVTYVLKLYNLHCPPIALRACLRCDFSVRLEANGCSCARLPALAAPWSRVPACVASQSEF
jgi:hypothetical protein